MPLRARILAVTLALFLVGLGVAGFTTYYFLSSFLVDRVDDQLEAAAPLVAAELRRTEPTLTTAPAERGETDFRLLAQPLGEEGTLVVAVPLTEVRATERLLPLIGGVVSGLVLIAIGVAAY